MNNHPQTEEPQDALDHLIVRELSRQAQWRELMQEWEQQQRRRRRLRLLPVLSNIASVAALMVLGLVLQALLPKTNLADQLPTNQIVPHVIQSATPSDSAVSENALVGGQDVSHE